LVLSDFSFSFAFPFLLGSLGQLLFSYMLSIMAESSYFILCCQIWKLHNPSIGSCFNLIQGCFKSPSMEKLSIVMKILIQFLNYWLHRHTLCMCASVCCPQCPTYRCGLSKRVKFLRFQANHSLTMLLFDSLVSYMLCAGGCSLIIWFSCTLIVPCTSTALISILAKTSALLNRYVSFRV
jgi:hypothetical protein